MTTRDLPHAKKRSIFKKFIHLFIYFPFLPGERNDNVGVCRSLAFVGAVCVSLSVLVCVGYKWWWWWWCCDDSKPAYQMQLNV